MALAQEALIYRERGELDAARKLASQALPLEIEAASLVSKEISSEPTRSILYQSAASLAFQAGDYAAAQRLVAEGLAGYPPPRVEGELKDLFEQINFESHLVVRNEPLRSSEVQLSISGESVGFGRVAYSAFEDRLRAFVTLLERTVRRLSGEPYGAKRHEGWASGSFTPILSVPRAGSFSITIELIQQNDSQHSLLTTGERVIDDVVSGVQYVQDQQLGPLRERISDESYFVNFVAQSHLLAPDGEKVTMVGLSTPSRQVAFTQTKNSFVPPTLSGQVESIEVTTAPFNNTVRGVLDAATASRGSIKLITDRGRKMTLRVHEGMDDAVRTYFNRPVEVRVRHAEGRDELESITGIDELE